MAVVTSAANLTDSLSFRKHSDPSKRCLHCNSVFYRRHAEPKKITTKETLVHAIVLNLWKALVKTAERITIIG